MAGAGYKLFNTGDVLTAAQVNTYLMEQTVMVFADAAARTTALTGVVSEGMISYLKDTNAVEVYNGSAWVASDDPNAIQNTIVDAKGDLITATAADTPARLAVGSNGDTLVADSAASTGLRWQGNFAAGKNKIINGDFNIWQRGTSFSNPSSGSYTSDRWILTYDGTGATRTISQQTFTPGTAPVSGYESQFFFRANQSAAGTSTYFDIRQRIEDVRTFAGQTITISFWAKAASNRALDLIADQDFGSGGSSRVFNAITATSVNLTTSWQRFSYTASVASISGKTIGTGSYLDFILRIYSTSTYTVDIWGVQLEAGNVATAFQTATGTLQGELAACQRYYYRSNNVSEYQCHGQGFAWTTTDAKIFARLPVTMRAKPTEFTYGNVIILDSSFSGGGTQTLTMTATETSNNYAEIVTNNATGLTANRPTYLRSNNNVNGYVAFGAEL
jgi:hypothetical protein